MERRRAGCAVHPSRACPFIDLSPLSRTFQKSQPDEKNDLAPRASFRNRCLGPTHPLSLSSPAAMVNTRGTRSSSPRPASRATPKSAVKKGAATPKSAVKKGAKGGAIKKYAQDAHKWLHSTLTGIVAKPGKEKQVKKSVDSVIAVLLLGVGLLGVGLLLKQFLPEAPPPPSSKLFGLF